MGAKEKTGAVTEPFDQRPFWLRHGTGTSPAQHKHMVEALHKAPVAHSDCASRSLHRPLLGTAPATPAIGRLQTRIACNLPSFCSPSPRAPT